MAQLTKNTKLASLKQLCFLAFAFADLLYLFFSIFFILEFYNFYKTKI